MKTNLNLALFVGVCGLIMIGCGSETGKNVTLADCPVVAERVPLKNGTDSLIVVDYDKFDFDHPIDFPLSDYCDYEIVKLEGGSKDIMVGAGRIYSHGNYLVWINNMSLRILIFDRQGHYVSTINGGEGPGNFERVCHSIYIDEEKGEIYANLVRSTKVYDLKTGEFKRSIDQGQTTYYLTSAPYKDKLIYSQTPLSHYERAIWIEDKEGNVEQTFPASYFWNMGIVDPIYGDSFWVDAESVLLDVGEDYYMYSLFYYLTERDSTYHYYPATNKLIPSATQVNYVKKNDGDYYGQEETPSYYSAIYVERGKINPQYGTYEYNVAHRVIVDKKTLKGSAINLCVDKLGMINIGLNYGVTFNGDFCLNLPPDVLMQRIEERLDKGGLDDKERLKLRTFYDSIDDDDNNYVIVGKLK